MNITKPSSSLVRFRQLQTYIYAKSGGFQAPLSERRVLLLVIDAIVVLFGVYLALLGWQAASRASGGASFALAERWVWFPVLLAGWLGLAWLNDLYHIPTSTHRFKTLTRMITVGFLAIVLYLLIFFFLPSGLLPRRFFLYFIGLTLPVLIMWRWAYGTAFTILPHQHNLVIVGTGQRAQHIKEIVDNTHNLNYHIVGFVTPPAENVPAGNIRLNDIPILGYTPQLLDLVVKHRVKEVVLAMDAALDQSLFETLVTCQAFGVSLSNMPDLFEKLEGRIPIEDINPEWTLQIIQNLPVFSRVQLAGKRLFDLVIALLALILS
ncbi:MAG: hypothetical protein R3264_08940, partial [Anaerolineae bacterium]|nr:hypothetical protein [Anaerolineae bacterium]